MLAYLGYRVWYKRRPELRSMGVSLMTYRRFIEFTKGNRLSRRAFRRSLWRYLAGMPV